MKQVSLKLFSDILDRLKKGGADQADIYGGRVIAAKTDYRHGQVETFEKAENSGLSLRVIKDHAVGFAYTSDLSDAAVEQAIRQALTSAKLTTPDRANIIPKATGKKYPAISDLYDPAIIDLNDDQREALAKHIEDASREEPLVKKTELITVGSQIAAVFLANSEGFASSHQTTAISGSAEVIAENPQGQAESGFGVEVQTQLAKFNAREIGREAGLLAASMLGAGTIPTAKLEIVLSPLVSIHFLDVITPMVLVDQVQRGKSLLKGKLGQKIASSLLTIIDDGTISGEPGSAPFDGEGLPTGRTEVVKQGIMNSFFYDAISAQREGVPSTGNADRGISSLPSVGPHNIFIQPGEKTQDEIIAGINRGFYITRVMGLHTANPVSGEFSLGASGYMIEKGKLTYPVRGVAIAGNLLELIGEIKTVGSNLRMLGGAGAPTLHLGPVTVSGA